MILSSLNSEFRKRLKVKRQILELNAEDSEFNSLHSQVEKACRAAKIETSQVKFYFNYVEVDEFGHKERRFYCYYESDETDAEYNARIEKMEYEDARRVIDAITTFQTLVLDSENVKTLIERVKSRGLRLMAPYQQKAWDIMYISSVDTEERVKEAYAQGVKQSKVELAAIKKRLRDVVCL